VIALSEIGLITPPHTAALRRLGIANPEHLLRATATPGQREQLAATLGVDVRLVEAWAACCDLMRVSGIGPEYAELLQAAGIDHPSALSDEHDPAALRQELARINDSRHLVRRLPTIEMIARWIAAASYAGEDDAGAAS
jgi:Domain of unknown function (DUF4332)